VKQKAVLSVLGQDKPGIVATVSGLLAKLNCNIEELTQTILQSEFAAIFIFSFTDKWEELCETIKKELEAKDLTVKLKILASDFSWTEEKTEPFVITAIGEDKVGQIAAISKIIADYNCNIFNIKASYKSPLYPDKIVMFYEVEVPANVDLSVLKKSLQIIGEELNLEITMQHKNIFENIHRI